MQPRVRGLILMALALLGACAQNQPLRLYEGKPRPESEIAVVRVPVELEVMRVNGRKIEGLNTLLSPGHRDLHLEPGRYRILAYYKDLWQMSSDTHDVIKTDPALFVVNARAGHRYRLGFDEPENIKQARAMEKKFNGYVLDTNTGEKTPTTASGLTFRDGILGNLGEIAGVGATASATAGGNGDASSKAVQPLAVSADEDAAATGDSADQPAQPNATAANDGKANTASGNSGAVPSAHSDSGDYLRMLKAYWSQATKEERRAFLKWISTQEERAKGKD